MELYEIQNAIETLNRIHEQDRIDYGEYSCIFGALSAAEEVCLSQYNAEATEDQNLGADGCVDIWDVVSGEFAEWNRSEIERYMKGKQS